MMYYHIPYTSDELYHYGVIGMKWGIRRYQNSDGTLTSKGKKHLAKTGETGYVYKSHATKKYAKKLSTAEKSGNTIKAEIYKHRLERSKEVDKAEQAYAKSVSKGGNLVTRFLTGGLIGGKGYQVNQALNTIKGKNYTKAKAFVQTALSRFAPLPYATRAVASVRRAIHVRQGEGKTLAKKFKE